VEGYHGLILSLGMEYINISHLKQKNLFQGNNRQLEIIPARKCYRHTRCTDLCNDITISQYLRSWHAVNVHVLDLNATANNVVSLLPPSIVLHALTRSCCSVALRSVVHELDIARAASLAVKNWWIQMAITDFPAYCSQMRTSTCEFEQWASIRWRFSCMVKLRAYQMKLSVFGTAMTGALETNNKYEGFIWYTAQNRITAGGSRSWTAKCHV